MTKFALLFGDEASRRGRRGVKVPCSANNTQGVHPKKKSRPNKSTFSPHVNQLTNHMTPTWLLLLLHVLKWKFTRKLKQTGSMWLVVCFTRCRTNCGRKCDGVEKKVKVKLLWSSLVFDFHFVTESAVTLFGMKSCKVKVYFFSKPNFFIGSRRWIRFFGGCFQNFIFRGSYF